MVGTRGSCVAAGQHAFVHAAVEQVDVAEEAVDEGRGRMVVHGAGVPSCSTFPLFIRTTWSATSSASSWSWVTKMRGHVQVVVQAAQPAAQFLAHLGVERAEGFVEQQHARLHRQRARQGDALALAARQLRRIAVGHPVQLHQFEQLLDLVADLLLRSDAPCAA
jgi:hypothetical protein